MLAYRTNTPSFKSFYEKKEDLDTEKNSETGSTKDHYYSHRSEGMETQIKRNV